MRSLILLFAVLLADPSAGGAQALVPTTTPLAASAPAAQSVSAAEPAQNVPTTRSHWYGYETFFADQASFLIPLLLLGWPTEAAQQRDFWSLSAAGYVLGAPAVHLIGHEAGGRALGDLGLRVAFAGVSAMSTSCGPAPGEPPDGEGVLSSEECARKALGNAIVGAILASMIDAAFLAWETLPVEAGIVPLAMPGTGVQGVGIVGRF